MNRLSYIIIILFSINLFTSCDDAFTTTKELEIPEHKAKLSVFSTLHNSTCEVFIGHSKAIDDTNRYKTVTANVSILQNGNEILSFIYPDDLKIGNHISSRIALPNNINTEDNYSLIVESNEYGTAKSSQIAPQKPVVDNFKYSFDEYIEDIDTLDKFEFDIIDPAEKENYYFFTLAPTFYKIYKYHKNLSLSTEDPIIKYTYFDFQRGFIISDKTFNGKNRKISLKISNYSIYNPDDIEIELDTVVLNIKGITKEYYNYLISRKQQEESDDNPFAEPVNVYSNIENGYGLFSIYNPEQKIIKIK